MRWRPMEHSTTRWVGAYKRIQLLHPVPGRVAHLLTAVQPPLLPFSTSTS